MIGCLPVIGEKGLDDAARVFTIFAPQTLFNHLKAI